MHFLFLTFVQPPMCRLYSTPDGFSIISTPSEAKRVRYRFSMKVSSWKVDSIKSSCLSLHFM